jgi:GxxExxY protein
MDTTKRTLTGAIGAVFRELGPGHSEIVYQNAVAYELRKNNYKVYTEVPCNIEYQGCVVGFQRLDMVIERDERQYIVEFKAVMNVTPSMSLQLLRYLQHYKSVGKNIHADCGFLINVPSQAHSCPVVVQVSDDGLEEL